MPMFVLRRNHVVSSLYGHNIVFKTGQPTFVPPICIPEVVAIGAECVDGPVDVLPPEVQEQIPLTAQEREEMVMAAMQELVDKNDSADFTGAGVPKVKIIEKMTGIDVDVKEVQVIWQKYKESKAG